LKFGFLQDTVRPIIFLPFLAFLFGASVVFQPNAASSASNLLAHIEENITFF